MAQIVSYTVRMQQQVVYSLTRNLRHFEGCSKIFVHLLYIQATLSLNIWHHERRIL